MIDCILPVRNTSAVFSLALTHLYAYGLSTGLVSSVVILDNGSTDPGLREVLAYAARQPRHVVIRHERNLGVWCSVNRGLATSRSKYALILNADLLIGPATIPTLYGVAERNGLAFVSPDNGTIGMPMLPQVYRGVPEHATVEHDYNGACWLLHWARLRDTIGWYDPQFYICFGDVDYVERLRLHAQATQDATWLPQAVRGLTVCHLDKQTRRHESAAADADMEVRDGARFAAKWAGTDVAARHPVPQAATQLAYKAAHDGGWDAGRVS